MPQNTGTPWSPDEDQKLMAAFREGKSLNELAALHERSALAVEYRLEKLGAIPAKERSTGNRFVATSDGFRSKREPKGTGYKASRELQTGKI